MRWSALEGKRIAIWGAGREARAAANALSKRFPGASLTIIGRDAEAMLQGEGSHANGHQASSATRWRIEQHEPDLESLKRFDVIVKSPGISPYRSPVPEAEAAGVRFVSGTQLWFAAHPEARVIAVTGTKGKSTTSSLIAHLLRAAGRKVALCGNIGTPLLELIDPPVAPEFWVAELSSFQTRDLDPPPEVAVVLNLYPEHLDWHGSVERYFADKLQLLGVPGRRPRVSVLNAMQALPPGAAPESTIAWFNDPAGCHVAGDAIWRGEREVVKLDVLPLPGLHNAQNLCAALTAIDAVGVTIDDVASALRGFHALPHRLQPLGLRDGIEYVNDSIATTPHATLAALSHYRDRAVTVLVGGYDRGVDWQAFRDAVDASPPHAIVAMGQSGPRIIATLAPLDERKVRRFEAKSLDEAMRIALANTPGGGVILLSPGSPSFGEFKDYVDRGRRFAALAGFDPDSISHIEGMGL